MRRRFNQIVRITIIIVTLAIPAYLKANEISSYKEFLRSLSKNNPASISKGLEYYKSHFKISKNTDINDRAFLEFRDFYYDVMENYKLSKDNDLHRKLFGEKAHSFDNNFKNYLTKYGIEFLKMLNKNGLDLEICEEGDFCVIEKYDFLLNKFLNYVSAHLKEYLQIRSKEMEEGFTEHLALVISFQQLGDRIIKWENFNAKYPKFILHDETLNYYNSYLSIFLTGTDNTPIFDYHNRKMDQEVKKAYEYFLQKYPNSKNAQLLKEYYTLIKKHNYTLSEEICIFLKESKQTIWKMCK